MSGEPLGRTGGTITDPAGLYAEGVGTCGTCGARNVPTVANGRLTAHGAILGPRSGDPAAAYRVRTCAAWGFPCREVAGDDR